MNFLLPALIIFSADYVLWPFDAQRDVWYPFRQMKGKIVDMFNETKEYYPQVPAIFKNLTNSGIKIAIVTKLTFNTHGIIYRELIDDWYGWKKFISYKEIYPGKLFKHLENIQKRSNISFDEMIFFGTNKTVVIPQKLNIMSITINSGITVKILNNALKQYAELKQRKEEQE